MNTFKLIPELDRVVDICEALRITPADVARSSDLHPTTVGNCFKGADNVSLKSYKRFIVAAEKVIDDRRDRLSKMKM